MDEPAPIKIGSNICCKVCGEKDFTTREGYFYCKECGTKQDQIREVEIEADVGDIKHVKKQKIHKIKAEKRELYIN